MRVGRALPLLLALILGIGASELLLQLVARISSDAGEVLGAAAIGPRPFLSDDPLLGEAPNPDYPGHDEWGFRNEVLPARAPIVALGDSQTYGTGVERDEAWPAQLSRRLGCPVYSLALPGWGATELLDQQERALSLAPSTLIAAFYTGNDLYDAYEAVYERGRWAELRHPEPAVRAEIERLRREAPLLATIEREGHLRARTGTGHVRHWLRDHSALYNLARAGRRAWESRGARSRWATAKRVARDNPESRELYEQSGLRTVFTPRFRSIGLDRDDPRIREGMRISLAALERMAAEAQRAGVRFLVLLIPTKETAFARAPAARELSRSYRRLVEAEAGFLEEARSSLASRAIAWIDATPALQRATARGRALYAESSDGHPDPAGHALIAEQLAAEVSCPIPAQQTGNSPRGFTDFARR